MKYIKSHIRDIALVLLLLVLSLGTRTTGLGTFLTADEKTWLGRSYEFVRAFHDVRFNDMLQTTHPGVTTLWTAGAAITAKMFWSDISFTNATLFHFIKSSQFSIAFLNAILIPCMYILLFVLLKRRDVAFLSALFIALDPFLIGYSRVVHVDALLGSFLTLAVIASILYARSLNRTWLIASAVLSALALVTKFPAVFIFPFIICAVIVFYVIPAREPESKSTWIPGQARDDKLFLINRFRDAIIWMLIVVLLILIIWPALLWVPNPVGNVLVLQRDISIAAVTPHDMTEDYTLNAYHYPAALLSRSNPITLAGSILGLIAIAVSVYKKKVSPEIALIALYLFGFVVMMTLGAKKGDRYIIPPFFALDILAAYAMLWAITRLTPPSPSFVRRGMRRSLPLTKGELEGVSWGAGIVSLVSIVYLISVIISYHPYAVAYSNPLFPDNISQELGWGEGLDQVALWLNQNHPNATVASWYPGELAPFTTANVLHINAHTQNQVQCIVLYKNMFGREPSHYANDFIDEYYKKREPVFVAHVAGKEFAWVYEKPSYSKTIGDLDASMIAVQEVEVEHEDFTGIRLLPATRFGEASTGILEVAVSRTLQDKPFFTEQVQVSSLKDSMWYQIDFPKELKVQKGERLFISIRALGSSTPYASLRYAPLATRNTPIYISRTGSVNDAIQKPGSLSIQLIYIGTDGKVATELETKLLK